MIVEYFKDKYIQVLQDKIGLQEKINALNSQVIDLKIQLLERSRQMEKILKPVQEENYKLKDELSSLKESAGSHDKYEKIHAELIASYDISAKWEAKVAKLKKDKMQEVLKENEPRNVKLNSVSDLISWRSVVKESRPKGTLSNLRKKTTNLIEVGIMNDFLVDRVEKELLADCIAEEGNKSVPAIPKSLVDEFNNWLGT
jgi:hypothetical protein